MGMTIDELQKYINALRKCAKEHDNDTTYTGHIIVSDLCRDTANLLETVEAIPKADYETRLKADMVAMLDKIRAEIKSLERFKIRGETTPLVNMDRVLQIIEKYKANKAEGSDKE